MEKASSLFMIMAAFVIAFSFACGTAVAADKAEKITVTVEIFSGRPNPTFEISDPAAVARLREGLERLPSLSLTEEQGAEFSRLGYRGILITHDGSVEGIPRYIQFLNGKVKVLGARGEGARFFKDTGKFEKHYLGLAKTKGLITELLDEQFVPDPDSMQ